MFKHVIFKNNDTFEDYEHELTPKIEKYKHN